MIKFDKEVFDMSLLKEFKDFALQGNVDFAEKWSLMGIKYGLFIQSIIDFLIVAFALFVFIKIANTVMKKGEEEEEVDEQTVLLTEIRDALREK